MEGAAGKGRGAAVALLTGSLAVGLVVVLVGGYAGHWTWTGFSSNDHLWDWLHLFLLPVVLGMLPLWLGTRRSRYRQWRALLGLVAVTFVVLIIGGYDFDWAWTGFQGNKLWDWLHLLVLPTVVVFLPAWLGSRHRLRFLWRLLLVAVTAGFVVLLIGGYGWTWTWTGFEGNTLWDWIELLIIPLLLPGVVAWISTRRHELIDLTDHPEEAEVDQRVG